MGIKLSVNKSWEVRVGTEIWTWEETLVNDFVGIRLGRCALVVGCWMAFCAKQSHNFERFDGNGIEMLGKSGNWVVVSMIGAFFS